MKKLTAILITCAVFICAAASCGDTKEKDTESSSKKSETTTVAETTEAEETTKEKTTSEDDDDDDDDDDDNGGDTKTGGGVTDTKVGDSDIKEIESELTKFAEVTLSGDVDGLLTCMYPKNTVDSLKESGYADSFKEASDLAKDSGKLSDCKAENVKELNSDALVGAEKYFDSIATMFGSGESELKAEKGYFLGMMVEIEKDGEKESSTEDTCIVYLKDEGWKIVPVTPDDLIDMINS